MEENDVKSVLDDFENDNFVDAQDKLQKIVRTARDEYIQNKLGLKNPLFTPEVSNLENKEDIDINNTEVKRKNKRSLTKKEGSNNG